MTRPAGSAGAPKFAANSPHVTPVAEDYQITINIEPHVYFTTKAEYMAEMLAFVDSPHLSMNMDTGNTFIAGLPSRRTWRHSSASIWSGTVALCDSPAPEKFQTRGRTSLQSRHDQD